MNLHRVHFVRNPPREELTTLAALVRDFKWRFPRETRDTCYLECRTAMSLEQAIDLAAGSIQQNGKMHSHQVKVRLSARLEYAEKLKRNAERLRAARSFHDLWMVFDELKPWGIGELTVYDMATRVGAFLKLDPQRLYMHTGARAGWLALCERFAPERVEYWRREEFVPKARFPKPLKWLTVDEVEDFLCTYRDEFEELEDID